MVVAFGTFKRQPQESFSEGIGAVAHVFHAVFFINDPAFLGDFVVSVKAGSQDGLLIFGGKPITCELPGHKFFIRIIFIERMDDPVAPGPHSAQAIVLVSMAIGVAGEVHPGNGHLFPVVWGTQ